MEKEYKRVYVVDKPTEFTKTYETASWYTNVLVQPGHYLIKYLDVRGNVTTPEKAYWGTVHMSGIVTESFFENRLFGSSSSEIDKNKGKADTVCLQFYASDLVVEEQVQGK